jgi:hypothetical protein
MPSSSGLSRICQLTFFMSRSCILSRIRFKHPHFGCQMPHPSFACPISPAKDEIAAVGKQKNACFAPK